MVDQRCETMSRGAFRKIDPSMDFLFFGRLMQCSLHLHVVVFDFNANFGQMRVFFFGTSDSLKKTITPSLQKPSENMEDFAFATLCFWSKSMDNFKPCDFSDLPPLRSCHPTLMLRFRMECSSWGSLIKVSCFWVLLRSIPFDISSFFC